VTLPAQSVVLEGVTKRFEVVTAVDGVSLEIGESEFFSLLGPSGCGKTTSLRMIAGFERPDAGRILIGDTDVTRYRPPQTVNVFRATPCFTRRRAERRFGPVAHVSRRRSPTC
jgi:ABC-type Fe3+/spermidine/putrescine transport system ATPase subunit